jgi:hypothetical protein
MLDQAGTFITDPYGWTSHLAVVVVQRRRLPAVQRQPQLNGGGAQPGFGQQIAGMNTLAVGRSSLRPRYIPNATCLELPRLRLR